MYRSPYYYGVIQRLGSNILREMLVYFFNLRNRIDLLTVCNANNVQPNTTKVFSHDIFYFGRMLSQNSKPSNRTMDFVIENTKHVGIIT